VELKSAGEADTEAAGALVASVSRPGDVVGLNGPLGAGKTVLVRGVVRALGGDPATVRSPTFTLLNIYGGRAPVYHFDLYRLRSGADLDGIGFYDFTRRDGVALVEWADRFPEAERELDLRVDIRLGSGPGDRTIAIARTGRSDVRPRTSDV
jgi:tRNA threonylcarbamoyl adenosine modification protein YjeE